MNAIDNISIEKPAIGKYITTSTPIEQLEENRLYLLASASEELAKEVSDAFDKLCETTEEASRVNNYGLSVLEEELRTSEKEVETAIHDEDCNLIMLMHRPGQKDFRYLLVKIDFGEAYNTLSSVIYIAERNTEYHLHELLHDAMLKYPDEFLELVKPIVSTSSFLKNFLTSAVHSLFQPTCGMVYSLPSIKEILGISNENIDMHQKCGIYGRLKENLTKYRKHKDKIADAELTYVSYDIPTENTVKILAYLTPAQLEKVRPLIDPRVAAVNSQLQIEICQPQEKSGYVLPTDKKLKNDGKYQLFLSKGTSFEHIHFSHKSSYIVYLMYLCDRYIKKDEYGPIDMLDKSSEEAYTKLYKVVYPYDPDAKSSYMTLTSDYNESGKRRKARLSDCYSEIRFAVANACSRLDENSLPHFISDKDNHIYTLPINIHIPEQVLSVYVSNC